MDYLIFTQSKIIKISTSQLLNIDHNDINHKKSQKTQNTATKNMIYIKKQIHKSKTMARTSIQNTKSI
ncbi:hypothetical protein HYN43_007040 [Mucilaginibacter celer]|uniref:Uncharacterized protein n=1 Tax=Mucilaginibacter celer TaxID=2305508 RepID=A0A494VJ93_9SPHI|nr:hypothetical protein HYN43_007040 [Mucilaginibacter celer]